MFIILREYELNTLIRRRDESDRADLTKARVIQNSVRFSENELEAALRVAVGSDQLLFLDLRVLPSHLEAAGEEEKGNSLPEIFLPDPSEAIYKTPPVMKGLKTYRLEYITSRQSREVQEAHEEKIDGRNTLFIPAPSFEVVEASLEVAPNDLRDAVKLIASQTNGFLSYLRISLHDDPYSPNRSAGFNSAEWAEPSSQPNQAELPA
jgi:hypothetical protein